MFAAYVLTITDGQDTQERNRLRLVAVTSDDVQRREANAADELDGDLAAKPLIEDPDTGMSVMKMKYFAGVH